MTQRGRKPKAPGTPASGCGFARAGEVGGRRVSPSLRAWEKRAPHVYPGRAAGVSHPGNVLENQTEVLLHPDQVLWDTCG